MSDARTNPDATVTTTISSSDDKSHDRSPLPQLLASKRARAVSHTAGAMLKVSAKRTRADVLMPARASVDASALSARLLALIGQESVSAFARKCGLPESVLRTYLKDGRMPPLDKAQAIAAAAGVSVDWLARGAGVLVAAEARADYGVLQGGSVAGQIPPVDTAVLEKILRTVLATEGAQASPAHLAALVADLYRRATAGTEVTVLGG